MKAAITEPPTAADPHPDEPAKVDPQAVDLADLAAAEIEALAQRLAQAKYVLCDRDGTYEIQRLGCICGRANSLAELRLLVADMLDQTGGL